MTTVAPGCASDAPTRPDDPGFTRPAGLEDTRAELADRRAATRGAMDSNLARPAAPEPQGVASSIVDFLGDAGKAALDVVSLLGVW